MGTHFFTSIAANYLAKARVLAHSIRTVHPAATIHVVWADRVPPWLDLSGEPFDHLIAIEELAPSWIFRHNLVELSTAVKGYALQRILGLPDCEQVVYLDPDIVVLSSLEPLLAEFQRASILLTPHLTEPESEGGAIQDNELSALQHGIFNLGFLGVKNSEEGRRFAGWWADRLGQFCFDERERGLFTDQRWADLIPAYFPDHKILRGPGFNVATWNLSRRRVTGTRESGLLVNGERLVFFHFSGLDSGSQAGMLERYGKDSPALFELRDWYLGECDRYGQGTVSTLPWAFGFYDDGTSIPGAHRKRYRDDASLELRFPNPFSNGYRDWVDLQAQQVKPALQAELPVPGYRIFLIAAPADVRYLNETLSSLLAATVNRSEIWLVGQADLPVTDLAAIVVDATRYEDFAAAVLRDFADKDLLIIRAGALPPPQWDVRLAWSAARNASALSVSPLDRRLLDEGGVLSRLNSQEIDRLCYWYRPDSDAEGAEMSPDCVYIRAAALQDAVPDPLARRLATLAESGRRLHYRHVQAQHLCVAFHCPLNAGRASRVTSKDVALLPLLSKLRDHAVRTHAAVPKSITPTMTGPTLHVMHSWSGGVEQWLRNFCEADDERENFVLQAHGPEGEYGSELRFFRYGKHEPELLWTVALTPAIRATAVSHAAYRNALVTIVNEHRIERLLVSSLIGHSLECLRLPRETLFICHDYYPFCQAINITFGETCRSCQSSRLDACLRENPHNRYFPNVARDEWLVLRAEFLRAMRENGITLIAPSPSVRVNYGRLMPELEPAFRVIPHGGKYPAYLHKARPVLATARVSGVAASHLKHDGEGEAAVATVASGGLTALRGHNSTSASVSETITADPLRILMLGSLSLHKGLHLFQVMVERLERFAEVTLAGCFDFGALFQGNPRIRVIERYRPEELQQIVAEARPDVGLLLSVVPETFSFTLQEMQSMGLPPVATSLGSFVDWIEDGVTGFLSEPTPEAMLRCLEHLQEERALIDSVHKNLRSYRARSLKEMIRDYAALTPVRFSSMRYFEGSRAPVPIAGKELQLYWRAQAESFSEDRSYVFSPFHIGRQIARLYFVPQASGIDQLRLDLGKEPGLIYLHSLAVYKQAGEAVWAWHGGPSLLDPPIWNQAFPLDGNTICLTGNDPFLLLPVNREVLNRLSEGGYVELDFWIEDAVARADDLRALAKSGWAARQEMAELQTELANQLHEMDQQLGQFARELAETDRYAGELEADSVRRTAIENDLKLGNEKLQTRIEELVALNAEVLASKEQVEAAKHQVEVSRAELVKKVDSLVKSRSWKLTAPLRTMGRFFK